MKRKITAKLYEWKNMKKGRMPLLIYGARQVGKTFEMREFGALYYYENKIKIMKSITVDSIDTTGAGDIFHGAFVYGTCEKMSLENIIKLSNVTAALSTTKYGSSISIPTKKEVKEKLNEYRWFNIYR